jgi:hypothetical protein
MTDDPSRQRLHGVPEGEGSERRRKGIEACPEVRQQDGRAPRAACAEPEFLMDPARRDGAVGAVHPLPVRARFQPSGCA